MHRLSYISGTGAAEVCLDCRSALAGTAEGIRGREWEYSVGYRAIAAATRAARKCSLSVTFLDLPYDLPYDLGVPSTRRYVDVGEWGAAPLRFVVYGPCVNPAVRIDGNWYRVDVTVPDGGYLVVDPLATPRSVTLVAADGSTADAFAKARRGNGLGSGEYVFQPASPGVHEVEWDRSFGFDLTWYEEEGEPPWS